MLLTLAIFLICNFFFIIIPYLFPNLNNMTTMSYHVWFNAILLLYVILPKSSKLYFGN